MCGIFAISGTDDQAGQKVLAGLKKLEYRGYDSWGIALKYREKNEVIIKKEVGKISNIDQEFPPAQEAFGHSRWATHGGVTKENAHPHKFGKVTLVHNGIFENYLEEKKLFTEKFLSETDSEVIAALLDKNIAEICTQKQCIFPLLAGEGEGEVDQEFAKKIIFDAIVKTVEKIEGRFAILVFVDGVDGIFAARRGSPLILGRGKNETFIASDIPAFLKYTNVVNYLDDDEMVWVHQGEAVYQNMKSREIIQKRDIEVPWKEEQAEKGDFPHFMIKEIFEQKDTIARAINHDDEELLKAAKLLENCNGAYIVACGTAHKVAMVAEYYFARISGRKVNVVPASEMPDFERFINEKTAVIAISQSGETADVMEVLERSKKKSAKILALTNVESSSMARLADVHLAINAGPEKAVASTKAATSQMALAFLLAYADAEIRGISKINVGREILRSTAGIINDNLNPRYEEHIREIARKLFPEEKLFIIGRGTLYPMALEAAIKIQEVSYIPALAFAAGELKHGPIALIENGTPCIVLGSDLETISNATELKSRGARIIGVATKNDEVFDEWIRVADCDGAQAIASVIPVQILAYHLAIFRGLDPDMPRNLAKSVTVK